MDPNTNAFQLRGIISRSPRSGKSCTFLSLQVGAGKARCFLDVTCFRELAETAAKLAEGEEVAVEGRVGAYKPQGEQFWKTSLVASSVTALGRALTAEASGPADDDGIPF